MGVTKHGENLIKITRMGMMNCYLVREDDGFTLIDTLMTGADKMILEAAKAHGGEIKRIALTHAHVDHIGSLDALHKTLPEAEVIIGERESRFMQGDMSLDADEPQAKPRGGFPKVETSPTAKLNEGDRVGSLQVVSAPGHTPGQVAYLDTRDKTLIVGDAYQTLGGTAVSGKFQLLFPLPAFATWHRPTALATAKKLRELEPARLAVGHGKVLESPLGEMDKAIAAVEGKWT